VKNARNRPRCGHIADCRSRRSNVTFRDLFQVALSEFALAFAAVMNRFSPLQPAIAAGAALVLALAGCNGQVYVRDGVTDGDTFYLAERALTDDDPVLQSWVAYSLAISTCQLKQGGDNPARDNSFECELTGRELLLDTWREKRAQGPVQANRYLDDLVIVDNAGFLPEYVASNFARRDWQVPHDLDIRDYRRWAHNVIPGHKPETRIVGSWNYARNVSGF